LLAYRVVEEGEGVLPAHVECESPLRESVSRARSNEKLFLRRQTMSK